MNTRDNISGFRSRRFRGRGLTSKRARDVGNYALRSIRHNEQNEQKRTKNEQICISKGFSNEQKRTIVRLPFLEWILVETPTKQRRMSKSEQAIFKGDSIRNEHEKGTCKQNRTSSSQGDFQTNNCSFVVLKGDFDRNAHETKTDEQ